MRLILRWQNSIGSLYSEKVQKETRYYSQSNLIIIWYPPGWIVNELGKLQFLDGQLRSCTKDEAWGSLRICNLMSLNIEMNIRKNKNILYAKRSHTEEKNVREALNSILSIP